jgi:type II secretory pathway pseudopilin PulG
MQNKFARSSTIGKTDLGFSFPDLLVVLAALSLIAAIAVPLVIKNRARVRQAQCMNNLNQVNRAVLLYADESQGTLPVFSEQNKDPVWWFYKELIKGHAGLKDKSSAQDKLFACPSDRGYTDPIPFWKNSRFDFSSYVFNGVNLPGIPNLAGKKVNSVKEPTKTLLTMEWTAHAPLSWHSSRTGKKNAPFYNNAGSMCGFVDGSVRFTPIYYDGIDAAFTRDPIPGYDYRWSAE